jgi:hypothetical protein
MADGMSMGARREVLAAVANRYRAAGRREKGRILDELTATTGWHRKHAVRALSQHVAAPAPSGSMSAADASAVGDDGSLPRRREQPEPFADLKLLDMAATPVKTHLVEIVAFRLDFNRYCALAVSFGDVLVR